MFRRQDAFTLLEVSLAVFIAVVIISFAVPSISGLLADRRVRQSFETFDDFVKSAQALSVTQQRAYLIVWDKSGILLRPEEPANAAEQGGVAWLGVNDPANFDLELPAALLPDAPKEWMFWPTGTCEPANVSYRGKSGSWLARYDPLTVHPDFSTR